MSAIFTTERLIVRSWTLDDAEAAFSMYGDPEVMAGLAGEVVPSIAAMRERLARIEEKYAGLEPYGFWALQAKADGAIVGSVLFQPIPEQEEIEVGWHLPRSRWGQGWATEAGRGALRYGFERVEIEQIYAVVLPWNERSIRVAVRLGMLSLGRTDRYYGREAELFRISRQEFHQVGLTRELHADSGH